MILAEGEATVPGYKLLIPAVPEIVWSLIFLVIFAVVFMRFVLPRLNAVLDERSAKIEGGLQKAQEVQEEAERLRSDNEQELAAARQEAAGIREKARQDGARIVEEAKARADAESERILAAGRQHLTAERLAASTQLRSEVGTLASDLASKIVGESLTDDERSNRVIDRFLADLESAPSTSR